MKVGNIGNEKFEANQEVSLMTNKSSCFASLFI